MRDFCLSLNSYCGPLIMIIGFSYRMIQMSVKIPRKTWVGSGTLYSYVSTQRLSWQTSAQVIHYERKYAAVLCMSVIHSLRKTFCRNVRVKSVSDPAQVFLTIFTHTLLYVFDVLIF